MVLFSPAHKQNNGSQLMRMSSLMASFNANCVEVCQHQAHMTHFLCLKPTIKTKEKCCVR